MSEEKQEQQVQENSTVQKTRKRKPYNRKPKVAKENQEKTNKQEESIFKKSKLKIIPLGGLHEVGKNITVFEYEDEIIIVDCGLTFPEDDMLGVDLVIPDVTYLVKNAGQMQKG